MIKFENTEVIGWEAAIRGIHNQMNSLEKNDSGCCETHGPNSCSLCVHINNCNASEGDIETKYIIGPNDLGFMKRLRDAGTDQRKFMRMITVYVDITAPLYWWEQFDAYKVETVANSCTYLNKIHDKEFTIDDFSCEHLDCNNRAFLYSLIDLLNEAREEYNLDSGKAISPWWQMVQLLPSSYNQKHTVMLNYEVLANIYKSEKNHELDEWSIGFMEWIKTLPYSELITGESLSDIPICNAIMEEAKKRVREGEE